MNGKLILFGFLTLEFGALTVMAVVNGGDLSTIYDWLSANPWGWQVAADLCIAVSFGMSWIWFDSKDKNINPYPYMALCLGLGSLGLLVYAARRSLRSAKAAPLQATAQSAA